MVRLEISVDFCANSWPCWERIATIAGTRVEGGVRCEFGGTVTERIGGALIRSDSGGGRGGGGGAMLEGLMEEK